MNEPMNGVTGAGAWDVCHQWLSKETQRERDAVISLLVPHLGKEIKFAKQNRFLSNEMGRGVRGYFVFLSLGSYQGSSVHLVPEHCQEEAVNRDEDIKLMSASPLFPTEASAQAYLAFQSI